MTPSIRRKLEALAERHQEVALLLAQPEVIGNNVRFRDLSREFAQLAPLHASLHAFEEAGTALAAARAMLADPELRELAAAEIDALESRRAGLERELNLLLLPKDARDDGNIFLEIRAGTGGDEAAIFAGDLFRMYARYAEEQGWKVDILSSKPRRARRLQGDHRASGGTGVVFAPQVRIRHAPGATGARDRSPGPHPHLRGDGGHPAGDGGNRGRGDSIPADLKVDTFRASGAGGQHVNKTDSAIRITHLPSGIVVECQDERSQHKNRARAMSLLKARLTEEQRAKQTAAQADSRRLQVGSGDRSEKIRTYNFPQNRVTDHRINLTLHRLPEILDGDLDAVLEPLAREYQAEQMRELAV